VRSRSTKQPPRRCCSQFVVTLSPPLWYAPAIDERSLAVGAFILATLIWSVLLAAAASYGRALITAIAFRWLNVGAGVWMVLCGVGLVWRTLTAR
jgi:hypothetical protein